MYVIVTNHVNRHRENLSSDREITGNLKVNKPHLKNLCSLIERIEELSFLRFLENGVNILTHFLLISSCPVALGVCLE